MGSSKKDIRDFPSGAQKLLGDELQLIQFGGMPKDVKPFKGVGTNSAIRVALREEAPCRVWQIVRSVLSRVCRQKEADREPNPN
jgi:phage-related protein